MVGRVTALWGVEGDELTTLTNTAGKGTSPLSVRGCQISSWMTVSDLEFSSGVALYLLTYLLTYSLTHSLTPWCRILLEKLIVTQFVRKYPYGTRRFITVFTQDHWTLS
jgi:hypothetical protein